MRNLSVAVCACTYRRPEGLRLLLRGLAGQTFKACGKMYGGDPNIRIVIVDNEGSDEARAVCTEFQSAARIPLVYVREHRRGISFARNACLDHLPPDCDFFAMIDDDEVPAPDWLDQLLVVQAGVDADVVQGQVVPVFGEDAPHWIAEGGFFGRPGRLFDLDVPKMDDMQELTCAGSGNVLVRTAAVRRLNLRFDPALALSGGEDNSFFFALHRHGFRLIYARQAIVYESVPAARATFWYMAKDRFRIANTVTLMERQGAGARHRSSASAALGGLCGIGLGLRRFAKTLISARRGKDRFAVGAFHIASGLGMIAAAFGYRYQHYK